MIPKFIYKTAPSLNPEIKEINDLLEKKNKGWKVKFYNDDQCLNFLINDFQNNNLNFKNNVIIAYNKLIPGAYKADLWRLCIIYEYGGVYIDATSQTLLPLESFLDFNKKFSTVQGKFKNCLQIAFFASVKNNLFLKTYIKQILTHIKYKIQGKSPLYPTGPHCAYLVAQKYNFTKEIYLPLKAIEGAYICRKTGKKVIKQYSKNHSIIIKRNNKNNYRTLWKKNLIYK